MNQFGVTLVELLVSLALSAITLLAAMQFMAANLQSSVDIERLSSLLDKAQHAMSVFEQAISRAGYLGCGGGNAEISSLLRTDLRAIPELNLFEPYVIYQSAPNPLMLDSSFEGLPIRRGSTTRNAVDGRRGIRVSSLVPDNDLLVVRGLSFAAAQVLEPIGSGDSIRLASRRRIGRGDFAAIVNCRSVEVFRITSHGTEGGSAVLHRGDGLLPHDNHPVKLRSSREFALGAPESLALLPVQTEFFFIAASRGNASLPALWKKDTHRSPVELLEGVTHLEVRELADADGHALGLRVSFKVLASQEGQEGALERRFIRHFAFENL